MTDDKELTARLRLPWPKDGSGDEVTLPIWVLILTAEAADRIEALTAELATCEKYRDAYAECDRIGTQAVRDLEDKLALMVFERDEAWKRAAHLEKMWGEAEAKLAECEARLGKAVEALEWIADHTGCAAKRKRRNRPHHFRRDQPSHQRSVP